MAVQHQDCRLLFCAGGGADPFTGATAVATQHIPARAYLLYDAVPNTEAMRRKILDLSAQLAGEPSAAALALTEAEVAAGGVLDSLLERWASCGVMLVTWSDLLVAAC